MRHDVKVVLRGLARAPLTAALAVCALAAATSVTASIFAVTRGVLLRELPYPDGDRLVLVWRGTSHDPQVRGALSPPDYLDVRAQAASFDEVAAINSFSTTYLPEDGPAEQVELGVVAGDFFRVLRADPLVGRLLMPSDARPLDTRAPGAVWAWSCYSTTSGCVRSVATAPSWAGRSTWAAAASAWSAWPANSFACTCRRGPG
jgi:hypothetical protein